MRSAAGALVNERLRLHCIPEVALEVLEALKLYLNIPQLVFIVGVDRPVIEQLVRKHYAFSAAPARTRDREMTHGSVGEQDAVAC